MSDRTLYRITMEGSGYPPGTLFLTDDKDNCVQVEYIPSDRPGKWKIGSVSPILVPIKSIAPYSIEVANGNSSSR